MDTFLPKGFEPGRARRAFRESGQREKLCVEAGGIYYPVVRRWATGFAAAGTQVPALRGMVRLFDGAELLYECLITGRQTMENEVVFTIKKSTHIDYSAITLIEPELPRGL